MIWYVIENNKRRYMTTTVSADIFFERGWGNGYVAVPPTHPLHLGDIDHIHGDDVTKKINLVETLDINGGITYNDYGNGIDAPKDWWVFGFDTAHSGDTIQKWPKEAVEAETKRLFCQLIDIELGEL
tara:strand:- start:4551 stop:4931 length:381 start_codon:yes stop_codon:yes gene_type:complete